MKWALLSIAALVDAGAFTWVLYKIAMWPRPGDFVFRGIISPHIAEGPITLSTDTRGLV